MPEILTLTMNPAVDKSSSVDRVDVEKKLRCDKPTFEPGGGGLNVSRAISRLGGRSRAVFPRGGPAGQLLTELLHDEPDLDEEPIDVADWTRENLSIFEEASEHQYRFNMPGHELTESEWQACLERLAADPKPKYIVVSGSLPPGVPDQFLAEVARTAAEFDARLIVDTSGPPLRQALEVGVFMIKPNLRELSDLVGEEFESEERQDQLVGELLKDCECTAIALSLGAGGMRLFTGDDRWHIPAPTVPIRSKVGAGDSTVAGIVLAHSRGESLLDSVRFGVAAGAAAVKTPGTELCRRDDVEELFPNVRADHVSGPSRTT